MQLFKHLLIDKKQIKVLNYGEYFFVPLEFRKKLILKSSI